MRKFTIPFLIVAIISGLYGFGGFNLWGTEAARVIFLIAADFFIVSLFARILFDGSNDVDQAQSEKIEA